MAKKYDESEGVWRTIGGRRVFIREGQSLEDAMRESGKFKSAKKKEKLTNSDEDKEIKGRMEELQREIDSGRNNKEKTERLKEELQQYKDNYEYETDTFEVGDLKRKALETLPKDHIDSHGGDLYIKKTPQSTELLNKMKDKDSGLLSTFRDQQTGEEWYDVPFANMGDDYKDKYYSTLSNNEIYEEAWKLRDETKDYNLKNEIDKRLDRIDRANRKGEGYAEKPTNELREILKNNNYDELKKQAEERKNNSSIQKLNDKILGDDYIGKGETPSLIYSNGRRIDIVESEVGDKIAVVWKDGKIERKTYLPKNVKGDKTKDYFDTYLAQLDSSSLMERYSNTADYLKNTTNMSGADILELLKKIDQDKNK